MGTGTLTEADRETVALFEETGTPLGTSEVADRLGVDRETALDRLTRLVETGHVDSRQIDADAEVWWRPAIPQESGGSTGPDAGSSAQGRELDVYETVFETVQDGIYVVDEDFCFVKVNDAYVEMTGYEREELLGAHSTLVVSDEVSEESFERIQNLDPERDESAVLEADIVRADGSRLRAESHFSAIPFDDGMRWKVGVVRDVSQRVERERELENRFLQQEVISDLGQRALEAHDLDDLLAEAVDRVAETLDTDYCKVLDLDPDEAELELREGVGWDEGLVGEASVSAVEDDSQAAYTLANAQPVVVEDLSTESRFSGPDLLTDHDVTSGVSTIIGPREDPWGILGTHDTARREFSANDVTFVQSVATVVASAVDRHEHEERLRNQREQIVALNNLNEVLNGITTAVVDESTREEIEATVCDRLARTDTFEFAWIGEVETTSQTVSSRTEAGIEGYLEDVEISIDPDDGHGSGPAGTAFRTGEIQTVGDVRDDPAYEPWRETATEAGFRSSAAIPIVHEDTVYGVLNVYSSSPHSFGGKVESVLEQLGEVTGHAIAAVQRKHALLSDEVVELEFRIENVFDSLGIDDGSGPIRLDDTVFLGDDDYVFFGRTTAGSVDTVEAMVEAVPFYEDVTVHGEGEERRFELRVSEPPVLSIVASLGGSVENAVIEGGEYRLRVHLAPSSDVRTLVEAMQETYPGANLTKRRQVANPAREIESQLASLSDSLTEKQRSALETAYHAGFFEWPRDASGEDIAELMDLAAPTFHQHLRKAEKELFEIVFESSS